MGPARLEPAALAEWCREYLGAPPERILFETGYLSQVVGLRLAAGGDVVVKVRAWQDRVASCGQVQHVLWERGFPAPRLLVRPLRVGDLAVSVEALVHGGDLLPARPDSAARFAEGLARLIDTAPSVSTVGTVAPSPAWVAWDHDAAELWPAPDDRKGDLNAHRGDQWLDEVGAAARFQLRALPQPAVVGHGDWYSQNLRWIDRRLHVVHDWDSVVAQPEAAIVGAAAAIWPGTGTPGEVATIAQTEDFLTAYQDVSGRCCTDQEVRAAWAAGLWTRAFDARKASLAGADPDAALTRTESAQRSQLAGL